MGVARFKHLPKNEALTLNVEMGGQTANASIPNLLAPQPVSGLARINTGTGQRNGDTLSVNTTGLSGITAYDWRIAGGASQGTSATLDTTGLEGEWVECVVTHGGGTSTTPAVHIYEDMLSIAGGCCGGADADDDAILSLVPHEDATNIAVADGDWTDVGTWYAGRVPRNGAHVLIPHGRTVTYDVNERFRLDSIRIDGTLNFALDQDTQLLAEQIICTRGSTFTIGTDKNNRLPAQYTATVIIGGIDYGHYDYAGQHDISLARDSTLWGRAFISQGTVRLWGKDVAKGFLATEGLSAGATSLTLEGDPIG
ncbi:MAG: G8 domain-containing protein, partial [Pseudomonadota bacterium]